MSVETQRARRAVDGGFGIVEHVTMLRYPYIDDDSEHQGGKVSQLMAGYLSPSIQTRTRYLIPSFVGRDLSNKAIEHLDGCYDIEVLHC